MHHHEKSLIKILSNGQNSVIYQSYHREPFFHVEALTEIGKTKLEELAEYCYVNRIFYTISISQDKEHLYFVFNKY